MLHPPGILNKSRERSPSRGSVDSIGCPASHSLLEVTNDLEEITDASTCLPVVILVPTTMAKDAED